MRRIPKVPLISNGSGQEKILAPPSFHFTLRNQPSFYLPHCLPIFYEETIIILPPVLKNGYKNIFLEIEE